MTAMLSLCLARPITQQLLLEDIRELLNCWIGLNCLHIRIQVTSI